MVEREAYEVQVANSIWVSTFQYHGVSVLFVPFGKFLDFKGARYENIRILDVCGTTTEQPPAHPPARPLMDVGLLINIVTKHGNRIFHIAS